jgi:chromosome partitioning protein
MLVPSRVDRRTAVGRRIYMTLERFGLRVGPTIRQRSAHIEAFESGSWIGAHAPTSPAYRDIRVLKDRILELLVESVRAPEHEPAPSPPVPVAGRTFGRRVHWSPNPAPVSPAVG